MNLKIQMIQVKLSELLRCNNMVADSHSPCFFGTAIQCEIAQCFPRSVNIVDAVKVGLNTHDMNMMKCENSV